MWEEMKGRLLVKGNCNGKQCCINRCSIFDGVVFSESFDIYGAENLVIWCSEGMYSRVRTGAHFVFLEGDQSDSVSENQ